MDVQQLLKSYPRSRPALPARQLEIHEREIRANRTGENWIIRRVNSLETWMHRKVAQAARPGDDILEIGAGTLNHLRYETAAAAYDAVEPAKYLTDASPHAARVRRLYRSVCEVPANLRYDRVLSIAVLEHVEHLPELVALAACLLKPHGLFQAAIPSEGGLLWGLGWRLTTGISYRLRNHASYSAVMRHEHINTAREIVSVLRWFFANVRLSRYPLPAAHGSIYTYVECSQPDLSRCAAYRA